MIRRQTRIITEAAQTFTFSRRALFVGGLQGAIAVALGGRMAWLAVVENQRYQLLAESNRVNLTMVPPRRGWMIDRNGHPIANNRTDFRVDIIPDRLPEEQRGNVLKLLQQILSLPPEQIARIETDIKRAAGFQPVQVAENLDWDRFAAVQVRLTELPGVAPTRGYSRSYPAGQAVAHLTGYVGAASAEQYKESKDALLITPGFKIGKDGLEKALEGKLRGSPGAKRVEVTAHGKVVRELETRSDNPGQSQRLTIDAGLQEYAARRLGTNSGSVVVMDVTNGDILAFVSMPAYDPNSFSDGISHSEWQMLSENDHVPLMNKTLQGLYPPGSTVKPMNGLALLLNGVSPDATVTCTGALKVGGGIFHCHSRRGHGSINMKRAIMASCDIYFYEMVRRLGYDKVAPVARMMGLGQKYDLPFPSQKYGTVPDSAWKLKRYKQEWTVADSLNASIGQGYVLVNPLQLAMMAGRIASGRELQPRILMNGKAPLAKPLPIPPEFLDRIRNAMYGVVNEGGTGGRARLQVPGMSLGAKTGTAQVRRITMQERGGGVRSNASLPFKLRDHALLVCFAPTENPKYAAGIVLEHGGHTVTALDTPGIGRDIITYLLDRDKAMAALAEVEPSWGGDIATRAAAEAAAYQSKSAIGAIQGAQTEAGATAPTVAPAVEAASNTAEAASTAIANTAEPAETGSREVEQ